MRRSALVVLPFVLLSLVVDAPGAPADPIAPPPLVMPTQMGSWCAAFFPVTSMAKERKQANQVMAGRATVSKGGIYQLSEHPDWQPQPGTDTSGDRHVNSLNWALPLLNVGVADQNAAMVERFRSLLYYWISDHQGKRGTWVDGSIYGGLRTQTFVCAAQTLNEPALLAAAVDDAGRMLRSFRRNPDVAIGANNTDLIRQLGAFGMFCLNGDTASRDTAWRNLVSVARGVVFDDGSDVEGSPGYALYIENLLGQGERAATTCGTPAEPISSLRDSLYAFVSQAVRPDFTLDAIGDTLHQRLPASFGADDPRAEWVRTAGASGTPPAPIYATFQGGYQFGRAGWQPQPGMPNTYYATRFTSARPGTAHTHDDGGSLTLWSRGVDWIGDPGPYRYENGSAMRAFMRTRTAHSSLTVTGTERDKARGVQLISSRSDWQTGGNDTTCTRDDTYRGVRWTRCVQYIRSVDAVVVVDRIDADRNRGPKRVRRIPREVIQRWQISPGISATSADGVISLTKDGASLDIIRGGDGGWQVATAQPGGTEGWFTAGWGEVQPGAVLSRSVSLPRTGGQATMVTVFVPRSAGEAVPVRLDGEVTKITRGGRTITTRLPAPA